VFAVCVLGVLGLRAFVGDLFRVTSASMAPHVWPDEVVLVRYDDSRPGRLEPVVFKRQDEYVIKRAIGVGDATGEDVLIEGNGDLRIDGAYLPRGLQRPRVLLFDQALQPVDEHFAHGSSRGDPWVERGGVLELDARAVDRGQEAGLLRYHPRLRDHILDRGGALVEGLDTVSDAAVEFEVRVDEPAGVLRVGLLEEGDTFWLLVELDGDTARVSIVRDDGTGRVTLAEGSAPLALGEWLPVGFANTDNRLTGRFATAELAVDYGRNTASDAVLGERVKLGGEACRLALRELRLWRDLHYTGRGQHAVGMRYPLEAGKLFVLGDNSANSTDSREYGPIDENQVVGRPVLVVWPPSAIRWLR